MIKKLVFVAMLLAGLIISTTKTYANKLNTDESKNISNLVQDYEINWNKHDIKTLAQIFTKDVSFVTVTGLWLKNRDEFLKAHEELHREAYKNSSIEAKDYNVDLLKSDIAIIHWYWEMKGVLNPDGTEKPTYKGIFTWVVVKNDSKWYVRASQNTISP